MKKLLGLPNADKCAILKKTINDGLGLQWLAKECDTVRMILRIRNAMMLLLGMNNWKDCVATFPRETTENSINSWINVFAAAKTPKAGRHTKNLRLEEIPASFHDWCNRLKRRMKSSEQGNDNNQSGKLQCTGEVFHTEAADYAVVQTDVDQIGRHVFKDDYGMLRNKMILILKLLLS